GRDYGGGARSVKITRRHKLAAGLTAFTLAIGGAAIVLTGGDQDEPEIAEPTPTITATPHAVAMEPLPLDEPEEDAQEVTAATLTDFAPRALPELKRVEDTVPLDGLPVANAAAATTIISDLPIDPEPDRAAYDGRIVLTGDAPIYATADAKAPVARLDSVTVWDTTALPIFDVSPDRTRVLVPLMARQAAPSPGQLVGWVPVSAGEIELVSHVVEVSLGDRELRVIDLDENVVTTAPVGSGKEGWSTPIGRSGTASVWVDDSTGAEYTEGHPVIGLTAFSEEKSHFRPLGTAKGTEAAPLIALHYHANRDGQVSNGCVRVDAVRTELLSA